MRLPTNLASHEVRTRRRAGALLLSVPLLFIVLFFLFPLGNLLRQSLDAAALRAFLERGAFLSTIGFTVGQALLSTALTLLAGLPAAYLFARYAFPGKSLLRALVTVPFVMPTVVVAAAFRALLSPAGPLNSLAMSLFGLTQAPVRLEQSLTLILIAHVFYNVAVVVRMVGGFWANMNPNLTEAAATLGASRWRAFRAVTLPLLSPPILGASLLVFLFSFTSFGVILILGGPRFSTIETEIYRQYVSFLRPDMAAVLSLIQILFNLVLLTAYTRWQQKTSPALRLRAQRATARVPKTSLERAAVLALLLGLTVFLVTPLLTLAARSLIGADGRMTWAYYAALSGARRETVLFIPPLVAVRNSLAYAFLTLIGAGTLGLFTATLLARRESAPQNDGRRRYGYGWLEPLFMLPLGTSAVTLGFAYVISLPRLRTSALLVLAAHMLVALPFVVRSVLPVMRSIQPSLREAAAVLGASPARTWREIDLPIIGRAFLVGAVFAFTVSMGEFGATSFIVRPNSGYLTLPIAIERLLGQPGALNYGQSLAMSTILMLVCAAGFVAIERFRYADIGEF